MDDPYLYPHTDVLKNLAGIQDRKILSYMEAEYTSMPCRACNERIYQ